MRFLSPLFALLASVTDSQMARMVEYLKTENRILRDKLPERIRITPRERFRLLKRGKPLGSALGELITIVTPRTFARWVQAEKSEPKPREASTRKPGQPRTKEDVRALILKLARETGWGYTRVLGELKKLGIRSVSRTTVANVLREGGLDPGPKRGEGTWDEFVTRHAATLWACDFFSVRTRTLHGVVDLYVLFFLHVGSRRVIASAPTATPDSAWVTQQARNASMAMEEWGVTASHLILDHDTKFTTTFDTVFAAQGTEVKRVGPMAPNLNAYAERWVQTAKQECLDHFVICGESHLRYVVKEFVAHYNEERPHQSLGNVPLPDALKSSVTEYLHSAGKVVYRERLGGLLRHYHRQAG